MKNSFIMSSIDSPWIKPQDHCWRILENSGSSSIYEPNTVLYYQGETTKYLYYLKRGQVKVVLLCADGSEKILAIHEPGSLIGEVAAIDRLPQFTTAIIMKKSEIIRIDPKIMNDYLHQEPTLIVHFLNYWGRKIRLLTTQISDTTFLEVDKRLAHLLLKLSLDFGAYTNQGIKLSLKITDQELANILGVCRVTVTKTLNSFKRRRLINKIGRELYITDPDTLTSLLLS